MTASRLCRFAIALFAALYVAALALFLVGTFGLLGQARDPLSAVFLLPLGWPWTRLVDLFPEPLWPWLATATPLLNLALIAALCRLLARHRDETR
jgi:hypothetical protein